MGPFPDRMLSRHEQPIIGVSVSIMLDDIFSWDFRIDKVL